jgi:hypothetical protein
VWIEYDGFSSRVVVEGSHPGRVQSLANDIEARLNAHSTLFGAWVIYASLLTVLLAGGVVSVRRPEWKPVLFVLAVALLPVSLWLGMKSSTWFPMIVVRHSELNLDLIGLIGILLGFFGLLASFIVKRRKAGATKDANLETPRDQGVKE